MVDFPFPVPRNQSWVTSIKTSLSLPRCGNVCALLCAAARGLERAEVAAIQVKGCDSDPIVDVSQISGLDGFVSSRRWRQNLGLAV